MRVVKYLLVLLAVLTAGAALAGQLSPGLEAYLIDHRDTGSVKALLVLEDQVDVVALDLDLHYQGVSFARRHIRVITELQEKARLTQPALLADLEARIGRGVEGYQSYWLINAVTVRATESALRELADRDDVSVVEMDLVVSSTETEVERHVAARSDRGIGIAPGVVAVGARRVWDELGIRGSGALIGVLSSGVDGTHPALSGSWRGNHAPWQECWLDVLGTNTEFPNDGGGGGTHAMGTMVGLAPDDTIGVAPAAEWIAVNAVNQGAGPEFNNDILDCLQFFTDPDGDPGTTEDVPDVVWNPWGVWESFSGYVDCYSRWWSAIDACEAAGVALVFVAGREGPGSETVRSPADRATSLYSCFSVGLTYDYEPYSIWSSSSRGPAGPNCGPVENRTKPEITAPGKGIYSSLPGGGYANWNATSGYVAGVMALMRSANPDLDVISLKQIIMDTAIDKGAVGDDNTYGHGFIDAYEAVLASSSGFGVVAGTVVDDDTGLPLEGALVSVNVGTQTDYTEADGTFHLSLPEGPVILEVSLFGYQDLSSEVTVIGDGEINPQLNLVPNPMVMFSGTVFGPGETFPGGTPTEGAVVTLTTPPFTTTTTGADGLWSLELPQAVQYTLRATLPGLGFCEQNLPATASLTCDLYLRSQASDDFESGDFSTLNWLLEGAADWEVSTVDAQEGTFAARSGEMVGSQFSNLNLNITLSEAGWVSFWIKTSGDGMLAFWDGYNTIESWSGQSTWVQYWYHAPEGYHTFRWRYASASGGGGDNDRAYLDAVVLPGNDPAAPRVVPCPLPVTVEVPVDGMATATLLVLNEGVLDLTWSLSDALPFVSPDISGGTVEAAGFAEVTLNLDAGGLAGGSHQFDLTLTSNDPDNPLLTVPVIMAVEDITSASEDLPSSAKLYGAVPNPFNPQTMVHYSLSSSQHVNLRVYDVQGHLVRELVKGVQSAGRHDALWDGRDRQGRAVPSGAYFARLEAGMTQQVRSMVLVR